MPDSFIFIALLLSVGAALFMLVPILRASASATHGRVLPAVIALLLGLSAFGVYTYNSDWNWRENGLPADPAMAQLYTLQKAANDEPANAIAWRELGRFYLRFQQADGALDALNKAVQLSAGRDPEANLLLVDALSFNANHSTQMRAMELINASLKVEPKNRKALWYGGELSLAQGKLETAIGHWQVLLAETQRSATPESQSVARLLAERISAAEQQLANPVTSVPPTLPKMDQQAQGAAVSATITLAPEWQTSTPENSAVFVLARSLESPGPPLAVQKLQLRDLPMQVTLSDDQAMLPSRKISDFEHIEIVARVSLGGSPQAQPGDYFGAVKIGPGDDRVISILINSVQP